MKNIIRKIKNWLIDKLGGYTKEDMTLLYKSQVEVRRLELQAWAKVVQELCRRSDNTYYDWACDYCETECDKRNSWCERFTPEPVNGFPHIDTNALDQRQQNNE